MNIDSVAKILEGFINPNEYVRESAEKEFNRLEENNLDELVRVLLQILRTDNEERKIQAIVSLRNIFRNFFIGEDDNAWIKIHESTQEHIKRDLFNLLVNENAKTVRVNLCDFIFDLAEVLLSMGSWDECYNNILSIISSINENLQASGISLLADLCASFYDKLNHEQLANIIAEKIRSNNTDLVLACTKYVSRIISAAETKDLKYYKSFIQIFLELLKVFGNDAIKTDDTKNFEKFVNCLISIADERPKVLDASIIEIFSIFLDIASQRQFPSTGRVIAMEFILTLTERRRVFLSNNVDILTKIVEVLIMFMVDLEEHNEWFSLALDAGESEDEVAECGEFGLDRLGCYLPGEVLMPIIFQLVGQLVQHENWKYKCAAMMAICQTIEFLPTDFVETLLGDVMNLLLNHVKHEHYRVRFAALHAIAQVGIDHQPTAQLLYYESVLPVVIEAFDDSIARVQAQAMAAFINYTEEVEPEDFEHFLPLVMEKTFKKLDNNYSPGAQVELSMQERKQITNIVHEQCITVISVTAGNLGETFMKSYSQIIPFMQDFISRCTAPETQTLSSRAIECLTIISFCIGKDKMRNYNNDICRLLVTMFNANPTDDDRIREYTYEAIRRMAKSMGTDFAEYSELFVVPILEMLDYNNVRKNLNAEIADTVTSNGGKTLKSDELETNILVLTTIVEACAERYAPYFNQTLETAVKLLNISYPDGIRRKALGLISELLCIGRQSILPTDQLHKILIEIIDIIIKVVTNETSYYGITTESLSNLIDALEICIVKAGDNILKTDEVDTLISRILQMIEESTKRRDRIDKSKKHEEIDEDDIECIKDELIREQIFRESCLSVIEACMKHNKDDFLAGTYSKIVAMAENYINRSSNDDKVLGLYVCADMVEYFGIKILPTISKLLEATFSAAHSNAPSIRRCAYFTISLLLSEPTLDISIVSQATKILLAAIEDPNSKKSDFLAATENAVSGIVNVILVHPQLIRENVPALIEAISAYLPLKEDPTEGESVHSKIMKALTEPDNLFYQVTNDPNNIKYQLMYYQIALEIYKSSSSNNICNEYILSYIKRLGSSPEMANILQNVKFTPKQYRGYKKLTKTLMNN